MGMMNSLILWLSESENCTVWRTSSELHGLMMNKFFTDVVCLSSVQIRIAEGPVLVSFRENLLSSTVNEY
jgi:hypothetical protein